MKRSLFPILFLVMAFVIVLLADDSLFEGISMTQRLVNTNTSNGAYVVLQSGTVIDPSCGSIIMGGTNGLGKTTLEACSIAGVDRTILRGGSLDSIILNYQTGAITIGNSGAEDITVGHLSKITTFPALSVAVGSGANWGGGDLKWSGNGGTLTNLGNFTSVKTITASNFVQSTGSAGGFVGNGSGLTNLPGTSVGGFTAGSTIFAGATGALSQDNANYFWDITNRRLGVGLNTNLLAKVHTVATNGIVFTFMGDSYSTTTNPEDAAGFIGRRARGTTAAPTAVQSGDVLSIFTGRGYGATGFSTLGRGRIQFEASENWTDTAQGSRTVFYNTASTTTNTTESMRIHNDGGLSIGTNAAGVAKLHVNGTGRFTQPLTVDGTTSSIDSGTNLHLNAIVNSAVGEIIGCYVTNVNADFASMATLTSATLAFTVPTTVQTNMVVELGYAFNQTNNVIITAGVTANGTITAVAHNVSAGTIDPASVQLRLEAHTLPTGNSP